MSHRWLAVGILVAAVSLLGLDVSPGTVEPTAASRVAAAHVPSPPDTLRASATVGTPVVLSLPGELRDKPVTRYTLLQGPALCGVAGRSFTWIPKDAAPGTYEVPLHAHHPDAEPDTFVVQIDLAE